jgi:hypothetical protein
MGGSWEGFDTGGSVSERLAKASAEADSFQLTGMTEVMP